ncbi:class 1 isoprenoid biosynthesis enzyme [Saccharopolyspora sp. NPDC050389]|uniref:class 1 isoprenoid biosynthesis enzyme n=1 Tax=Saccharopolyspora sp. NPDC050389 TaxID=3155516 RepID=UPI003411079B
MDSGLWRDLLALGRSVELAGAVPSLGRRAVEYVATYERVVAPIVESTLGRSGPRRYVDGSMCEVCATLCFLVSGYAAIAKVPFRADLAVLGGAVARVYDDLVDEYGDDDLLERLSTLFAGGAFAPANAVERLLFALYLELARRLGRSHDDPINFALAALHEVQVRSQRQRDPTIPSPVLAEITRAKGGHALVVLFALQRPAMGIRELELVRELGEALQLLDDYMDVAADRKIGITTSATRGELSLAHICRQLRRLRPALCDFYGRSQPLCGVIYVDLWGSFLRRRWPSRLAAGTPARVLVSLARKWARVRRTGADR